MEATRSKPMPVSTCCAGSGVKEPSGLALNWMKTRFQISMHSAVPLLTSAPWVSPKAPPLSNTSLVGFTVAGEDKTFYPADAKIDGNTVVVSSAQVPQPVAVRYAFTDAVGNLYNKDGLPAPPFRSDDWVIAEPPKPAPKPRVAPAAPPVAAPAPVAK